VKIVFHPRVYSEIEGVMRYYEETAGLSLADDFYQEFRRAVLRTAAYPEHIQERIGGYKRVNLKRFPYNFLFREGEDYIRILVVRHNARHPNYGGKRK
jgi:plasmid stabilization system protein ParE